MVRMQITYQNISVISKAIALRLLTPTVNDLLNVL